MKKMLIILLFALFLFSPASSLFAGMSIYNVDDVTSTSFGAPYTWPRGVPIILNFNTADLNNTSLNDKAITAVMDMAKLWQEAKVTTGSKKDKETNLIQGAILFQQGGTGFTVNKDNFSKYYSGNTEAYDPKRETMIVFDEDGKIFEELLKNEDGTVPGNVNTYLGVTDIFAKDKVTRSIKNATIILNGAAFGTSSTMNTSDKAAILHELGHLLNLDHTALNDECEVAAGPCGGTNFEFLPTMHYSIITQKTLGNTASPQMNLFWDDAVWAGWIYNLAEAQKTVANIRTQFCTITGKLLDVGKRPVQGIQVIARAVYDNVPSYSEAVSTITGGTYPACAKTKNDKGELTQKEGMFILPGILPNQAYRLTYSQIPYWGDAPIPYCKPDKIDQEGCEPISLGSGVNPFAPPRPLKKTDPYDIVNPVTNDVIFTCNPAVAKQIDAGEIKVDIDLDDDIYKYYRIDGVNDNVPFECSPEYAGYKSIDVTGKGSTGDALTDRFKKGWCTLVPTAAASGFDFMWLLLPVGLAVYRRFKV